MDSSADCSVTKSYRHLVSRYHDAIGETAKTVLRQESEVHAPPPYRTLDVSEESEDEQYLVRIEDGDRVAHRVRLHLDSQSYTYEGCEE